MIRFLYTFILIIAICIAISAHNAQRLVDPQVLDQPTEESESLFELSKEGSLLIVKFKPSNSIELLVNDKATLTTESFAKNSNCIGMINAGYFLSDYSHAGFLKLNGEIIANLARTDTQITHVVSLDTMEFNLPAVTFDITESKVNMFQTGPLLIQSNTIQNELIQNSINGDGNYLRSALGYTDANEILFIANMLPITLENFSEEILKSEILANKTINVINLDGGSSVSLYTKKKEAQYGIAKKLPFYLCVK